MLNTDSNGTSELNHNLKATLIVDCDGHVAMLPIEKYPDHYDAESPEVRTGIPVPTAIELYMDKTSIRHRLFTASDVTKRLGAFKQKVNTVLKAGIVNDKQRAALDEIVSGYFCEAIDGLYQD